MIKAFCLLLACGFAAAARADEIIGIESADTAKSKKKRPVAAQRGEEEPEDLSEALEEQQAREPPPKAASGGVVSKRAAPSGGDFYLSGGIWPGAGYFSGIATVGYAFNPYVGVETSGHYSRFDRDGDSGETYGPELDLVLRGANPTILTPFVGAGPGYEKWRRAEDEVMFSDGQTLTANAFAGVSIALTRHFGLSAMRKQRVLVEDQPRTYADHEEKEPKEALSNHIGFHVVF
jgi:hypothetical protein